MIKKVCLLTIGILWCVLSFAQISFAPLNSSDQLSNYSVMSLYQDERGFIWIGTKNGLNLYDGKHIKTFTVQIDNEHSLQDNSIVKVTGDKKGYVYVLTYRIDQINTRTEMITHITTQNTTAMFFRDGVLYYALGNHLYERNRQGQKKLLFSLPSNQTIHSLAVDNSRFLLGTNEDGLFIYEPKNKRTTHLLQDLFIETLYLDKKNRLWIGTQRHGYYIYDSSGLKQGTPLGKDNDIRIFCEDNINNMWIGTMNGLYQRDALGNLHAYTANKQINGLKNNSIWALLKDWQGNMWVGSYFGGVESFSPEYHLFKHYSDFGENSLSMPVIGNMIEDQHRNLWISTDGGGINCLNRNTDKITRITTQEGLSHNNVRSLCYDKKNDLLYIGMHMGGLDCLDVGTHKIKHCLTHPSALKYIPSRVVNNIVQWKNQLVLATHNGIVKYDVNTGKVNPLTANKKYSNRLGSLFYIYIDKQRRLWGAHGNQEILAYDMEKDNLYTYSYEKVGKENLKSNSINYVLEDSKGRIWICSGLAGLLLFNEKQGTFSRVSTNTDRTISNCTFGMCEIGDDQYLVETNQGFYIYNHKNKHYLGYTNHDELPLVSTFQTSLYKTSDGMVFLGGINGLISFYPKDLINQKGEYNIYPSRLLVNGMEISPNDESGILSNVISYTKELKFTSTQSNFSIEYSIIDFIPNHRKELEYYLKGYSKDWLPATLENIVSFTHLDPGNYTLKVRLKGQEKCSILHIQILPPFYLTTGAYILYIILAVIIILFLNRTYKRRIRLQEQVKYEQKRVEYVEEINQSKMRFFTNISHEFRTPLTVIIGNTDRLIQTSGLNPTIYNKILSIHKASSQLKGLISELLDFRKQEQGQLELHVTPCDMVRFLSESIYLFAEYAKEQDITITFDAIDTEIEVWMDTKQIQKVINNLVFNALKHTHKGDSINVSLRQNENEVTVRIQDTGCGIPQAELDNIFRRFYQLDISSIGTGIGLALSKNIIELHHGFITVDSVEGKGSTFSFTLPKDHAWCKPENLSLTEAPASDLTQEEELPAHYLPEQESENKDNKEQPHILVVEDNEELQSLLKDIFSADYQVSTAADGEEAWKMMAESLPDLVLTDVVMPNMNGIDLCKRIKESFDTSHIPVVMLTARVSIEHNLEGLNTGADDYITKPFNTNILLLRCNNIIRNRKMLQEKFAKQIDASIYTLTTNNKDKKFMEDVMAYIEKNIDNNDLNMEDFAASLFMSRSKFFGKLKSITGQTPHDFLLSIRMKRAMTLLKTRPDLNITEIGSETGFGSLRYFSKCFKEAQGCTPMEYRKNETGQPETESSKEEKSS